jgi:GR25 family glycosyltransferase involved in LPS biosynthesis
LIGIVAHLDRLTQTEHLASQVQADHIAYDDGSLGCEKNHQRLWRWHTHNDGPWALTLEDDAVPVDGFGDQLSQVLQVAPTPIVSLYLGRSRPLAGWQTKIAIAVDKANKQNAHWITSTDLLHAVGVCIRSDLVPSLIEHLPTSRLPIDAAISQWAQANEHQVGYCWPSLLDHADGPTLVLHPDQQPRDQPRIAWWHGARDSWTDRTVEM